MTLIQKLAALESKLSKVSIKLGYSASTLTFKIPVGTVMLDNATGIEAPVSTSVVIKAYLEQSKRQTRELENIELPSAFNASAILMQGYLIDPVFLPASIRPLMEADLVINDPNYPMQGKFLLLPSLQNEDTIANHTIRGYALLNPGAL